MPGLSQDQIAAWKRDGYLFPFPMLDAGELAACLDGLARYERWLGAPVTEAPDLGARTMPYLILPWAAALARDPRIVDKVADLIGPDILIFTSTFFVKEPMSPTVAAWHQDATYYGIEPREVVTVWLALSEASTEAGCMEVLPFDGEPRQMAHVAHVVEHSVNRSAQVIVEPLDDSRAVAMPLPAGAFSMHHGLTPHRSAPNRTAARRVGMGFNYIPTHVRPAGAYRTAAMLVRGEDRCGHFELLPPATEELTPDALARHDMAVARYRETYCEQEPLHLAAFA